MYKFSRQVLAVITAFALLGLGAPVVSQAAVSGPVVRIGVWDSLTSLNPDVSNYNLSFNREILNYRFSGFTFENKNSEVEPNKTFGSYRVISNTPFRVQYTVNPGRVWSDEVPITAVDLLLHHTICSSVFSEKNGLGKPLTSGSAPIFNSNCYGGTYDENISKVSISSDKLSLIVEYKNYFPTWESVTPRPFPVHALVLISEGNSQLASKEVGFQAKARFENAWLSGNSNLLSAYGKVWSSNYILNNVTSSTNPLLLIGNGGYKIESASANDSLVLTYNEKYNSGPRVGGISKIIYKINPDGNALIQAIRNSEIDIYQGTPTADAAASLKSIPNVNVIGFHTGVYEHIDLRANSAQGVNENYTGIFSGNNEKARDLRRAFLLTIPREEINDKLISPVTGLSNRLDSLLSFPNGSNYETLRAKSGIDFFTKSSLSIRQAQALSLVQKYFPNASAGNPIVKVNLLWGTTSNARRIAVASLIKNSAMKAGFDINAPGVQAWSSALGSNSWDGAFFAWVRQPGDTLRNSDYYCSNCALNYSGWRNSIIDSAVKRLRENQMSDNEFTGSLVSVESQVYSEGLSLPLYQHPAIVAVSKNLKNISPSSNQFPISYNYWEWNYLDSKPFDLFISPTPTPTPTPTATQPNTFKCSGFNSVSVGSLTRVSNQIVQVDATVEACSYEIVVVSDSGEIFRTGVINATQLGQVNVKEQFINATCTNGYSFYLNAWTELNGLGTLKKTATNRMLSATCAPASVVKPTTPTFSGVNFAGNTININVNIGSSASSRPDKIYLVAPKLGVNSSAPLEGKISGSTASWSLPLNNILSGVAIPLEIVGEKNGVKSEPLTGSYTKPAVSITAVPPAPTNYSSRIVGTSAIITIQVSAKESSRASSAHLYSSALGIKKGSALQGEVVGTKALIEVPIKASMAGKKYPLTIYLENSKGESKPLNATLSIPKAPKAPTLPTAQPKPVVPKAVICSFGSQTRTFEDDCPPGWVKR